MLRIGESVRLAERTAWREASTRIDWTSTNTKIKIQTRRHGIVPAVRLAWERICAEETAHAHRKISLIRGWTGERIDITPVRAAQGTWCRRCRPEGSIQPPGRAFERQTLCLNGFHLITLRRGAAHPGSHLCSCALSDADSICLCVDSLCTAISGNTMYPKARCLRYHAAIVGDGNPPILSVAATTLAPEPCDKQSCTYTHRLVRDMQTASRLRVHGLYADGADKRNDRRAARG